MSLTLTAAATVAAQMLGVLDSGESLSTQQIADALALANNLLDNWSSDPKMILSLTSASGTLASGTQSYTIGSGQTINITRPMAIVSAAFKNSSGPGGAVKVCNAQEWSAIPNRQRQSWIIENLFYDRGYSTGNVYVSPIPQGNGLTLDLWVWAALAQFADATTPLSLLPGYERLLKAALALEMAPQYDVPVPPSVQANYAAALASVQNLNADLFGALSPQEQAMLAAAK